MSTTSTTSSTLYPEPEKAPRPGGALSVVPKLDRAVHSSPVYNDYSIDLEDIATTIRVSDVLVMRFISAGQRLLLDFRASDVDGPIVRVVEPVQSVQERYRHLSQIRPRMPLPEKIVAVSWPRYVSSLGASPVWDEVMRRVSDSGHPGCVRDAMLALDELTAHERAYQRAAIHGEGFRTLWSASPAHR